MAWITVSELTVKQCGGALLFIAGAALEMALDELHGTADHMLKIWFVLKQMGMTRNKGVLVTTSSPDDALKRLFSFFIRQSRRLLVRSIRSHASFHDDEGRRRQVNYPNFG